MQGGATTPQHIRELDANKHTAQHNTSTLRKQNYFMNRMRERGEGRGGRARAQVFTRQ